MTCAATNICRADRFIDNFIAALVTPMIADVVAERLAEQSTCCEVGRAGSWQPCESQLAAIGAALVLLGCGALVN